jgi:ATP-dependent Clp endopeptidase proteolytic subunit ClpP
MGAKFFNSADSSVADVYLTTEIDDWFGIGKNQFMSQFNGLNNKDVNLYISSPGGNVDDALAMYDFLKNYKGKVTAKLSGIVASSATIVALGADSVEMNKSALFMIHNPWGVAQGDAEEMRKTADIIDKLKDSLVSIYQSKVNANGKNKKASEISAMMDSETWMNATEALDKGFVDTIAMPNDKAVKNLVASATDIEALKKRGFLNIPIEAINQLNNKKNKMKKFEKLKNEISAMLDEFKASFKASVPAVQDNAIEERVKTLEASIEAKYKATIEASEEELEKAKAELEAAVKTKEEKEAELAKANEEVARLSGKSGLENPAGDKGSTEPAEDSKAKVEALMAKAFDLDFKNNKQLANLLKK